MIKIQSIREDISKYIKIHNIEKQFQKSLHLFKENPNHPSLNNELLEPKHRGIYSFRINKKYRAIYFYYEENKIEIIAVTNHYKK